MADTRTMEQRAADDRLTEAIQCVVQAYGFFDENTVNTQYMVLVDQRQWREDGDDGEGMITMLKDNSMPWSAILGLLRKATLSAEEDYLEERRNA